MPNKNLFFTLPDDVARYIFTFLDTSLSRAHASQACRSFYLKIKSLPIIRKEWLESIRNSNRAEAEIILEKQPELMLEQLDTFEDNSGRVFSNITPWQYSLWAMDVSSMAPMMLDCLPNNEKGMCIAKKLIAQFDALEKEGISFTLDGEIYQENHYNFQVLIDLRNFNKTFKSPKEEKNAWLQIGRQQYLLPANVVREYYCLSADPASSLSVYIPSTKQTLLWWEKNQELPYLGHNFAIFLGQESNATASDGNDNFYFHSASLDTYGLNKLQEEKKAALPALRNRLQNFVDTIKAGINQLAETDKITASLGG